MIIVTSVSPALMHITRTSILVYMAEYSYRKHITHTNSSLNIFPVSSQPLSAFWWLDQHCKHVKCALGEPLHFTIFGRYHANNNTWSPDLWANQHYGLLWITPLRSVDYYHFAKLLYITQPTPNLYKHVLDYVACANNIWCIVHPPLPIAFRVNTRPFSSRPFPIFRRPITVSNTALADQPFNADILYKDDIVLVEFTCRHDPENEGHAFFARLERIVKFAL